MVMLAAAITLMMFASSTGHPALREDAVATFAEHTLGTSSYKRADADLDGDGRSEAFLYLTDGDYCGSGGCTLVVLAPKGSSYRVVLRSTVTQLPIRVLPTSTRGWRDIGQETGRRLAELNRDGQTPSLGARRYQIAAILSFYTPGQPEVQLFPTQNPAGNQYRFWDRTDGLTGRDILYVCEDAWESDHLRPFFRRVNELTLFQVRQKGRVMHDIRYYLAEQYDPRGPNAVGLAQLPASEVRP
jgi:hypothetical protein